MDGSRILEVWSRCRGIERVMEADDGTRGLWVGRIRSRMHPDKNSLAISLTTKLNLRLSAHQISRFSPLDRVQSFKTLFLNRNFLLHVTRHVTEHMTEHMTELSFVYSRWASLWARGSSDQLTSDQLTCLEAPPFYKLIFNKKQKTIFYIKKKYILSSFGFPFQSCSKIPFARWPKKYIFFKFLGILGWEAHINLEGTPAGL